MAFDEVRLPDRLEYGAHGGPRFKTTVHVAKSGHEQRVAEWQRSRGEWTVGYGLEETDDSTELIAFYRARNGRARGFRFKDWTDYRADMTQTATNGIAFGKDDVSQNTQDGANTTFQLVKAYTNGGTTYTRPIYKPVESTVQFWIDTGAGAVEFTRVASSPASGEFSVDDTTGLITLNATDAPAALDDLYWDGEFDVPVRFDEDVMDLEVEFFAQNAWRGLKIVEIRDIS